jgi:hypothetical protein
MHLHPYNTLEPHSANPIQCKMSFMTRIPEKVYQTMSTSSTVNPHGLVVSQRAHLWMYVEGQKALSRVLVTQCCKQNITICMLTSNLPGAKRELTKHHPLGSWQILLSSCTNIIHNLSEMWINYAKLQNTFQILWNRLDSTRKYKKDGQWLITCQNTQLLGLLHADNNQSLTPTVLASLLGVESGLKTCHTRKMNQQHTVNQSSTLPSSLPLTLAFYNMFKVHELKTVMML